MDRIKTGKEKAMKLKPIVAVFSLSLLAACTIHNSERASRPQSTAVHPSLVAMEEVTADQPQQPVPDPAKRRYEMKLMAQPVAGINASIRPPSEPLDRENYAHFKDNPLKRAAEFPVSTFSIDVDSASYANLRRILNEGRLPPMDAVRVEEMINYFNYEDVAAEQRDTPFGITTEIAANPWNPETKLLRIGIKAWQPRQSEMPPANLVFLVDVSGSMHSPDKLPLLKRSLRLLSRSLDADDRVSLVVYAGASGVVLEPTPGNQRATIEQALQQLSAGGSTNGGAGIRLAYAKAREAFIEGGINRAILATDGDFNVGTVNHQALIDLIKQQRQAGIALTTLGFGGGNYNDHLMEQLADQGDGNYAYIDSLMEARKVLVRELGATLQTVAKDVKIQIEFNPEHVTVYRLVGYENRLLAREDFNNDKVDAGEIGAGHSISALYEISLSGSTGQRIEPLRYAQGQVKSAGKSDELAFLKLRFKHPGETESELIETPILASQIVQDLSSSSDDFRFAAAVAAFGQSLHGGKYLKDMGYDEMIELARGARGNDPDGERAEFVRLLGLARDLSPMKPQANFEQTATVP
jgi:Ca-activated chloride channel family protein